MPVREVEECSRLIKNRLEKVDHVNTVKTRSSNVLPEVAALLTPVLTLHPTEFEAGRAKGRRPQPSGDRLGGPSHLLTTHKIDPGWPGDDTFRAPARSGRKRVLRTQ